VTVRKSLPTAPALHELSATSTAPSHAISRSPEQWQAALPDEPRYRALQIFRWIQRRGVFEPAHMSDLPLALRQRLAEEGLAPPARVSRVLRSADGTRKLLLELEHGGRVECVLIPMTRAGDTADEDEDHDTESSRQRVTLCLSTQFGCAMGCVFCASGRAGLVRGLGAAEIVAQVLLARRELEPNEALTNLVFMGMGEPLHHYEETAQALRLLSHSEGAGISLRRITVSTVGLVPGIARLGRDFGGKVGLAVSLHAPEDETRSRIVPINRRYPMAELIAALRAYPLPQRRRITIEYTLIAGINDAPEHAVRLARVLRGLRVKINLIPMNRVEGSELAAPSSARVEAFREELVQAGYSCFLRTRRGDDVAAACGQLALSR
jgi:23S rRNA (adenine2503-C2)-methyltransferase